MDSLTQVGPRIQREFLAWYRLNVQRLAIPLRVVSRSRNHIELAFVGIAPVITARLSDGNLMVTAQMNGRWFDIVADFDAIPLHLSQGYVCTLYDPDERTAYRTRTEFWREHLFEYFLAWVNEQLAPARWIRLSCIGDGSSWAKLIRDESQLKEAVRGLLLMQQLKRLDGEPAFSGTENDVTHYLLPLR